jgi:hypothetical protein
MQMKILRSKASVPLVHWEMETLLMWFQNLRGDAVRHTKGGHIQEAIKRALDAGQNDSEMLQGN